MALNDIQQLHKLIEDSKNILLCFGAQKNDDSIASALALKLFLEKQNKITTIASDNFIVPKQMHFLPQLDQIKTTLSNLQKMTIRVDVSKVKLESVSYEVKDGWLSIFLTPKEGNLSKENLHTTQTNFKFDLIITIGVQDLESLGDIFFHNSDLFYKTPIVNFDYHTSNERFGQINIVEINTSSNSEIIFKTLEQLGAAYIDEKIATCLLTGMISQTGSFKSPNVTPATLNTASHLMNLGADREKIIKNLYRTKSIYALKLWGRALSNLQFDQKNEIAWTIITREDFIRSGAKEEDLHGIISELIANSPEARIILLLHEFSDVKMAGNIKGFLVTGKDYDASEIVTNYEPQGNKKSTSFILKNRTLNEAEKELTELLRTYIQKRLK